MKIPAWASLAFKIVTFLIATFITLATSAPDYFGGKDMSSHLVFWLGAAQTVITGVFTILGTGNTPSQTLVGKVACFILAAVLASSLLIPSPADAAAPKHRADQKGALPIPLPPLKPINIFGSPTSNILTGNPTADLNKLYAAIQAISLADLQAAKSDADATKDTLASNCYAPLIGLVQAQQSVDLTKLGDGPHLVLIFQRGRDLFNALRPGSPVSVGCAPLAEEIKMDVTTLVGGIAAGTLTMASFGL